MAWFLPVLMNFWQIHYTTAENPSLYFICNLLMFCETAVGHQLYSGLGCSENRESAAWEYSLAVRDGHEAAIEALCNVMEEVLEGYEGEELPENLCDCMFELCSKAWQGDKKALAVFRKWVENGDSSALTYLKDQLSDDLPAFYPIWWSLAVSLADAGHEDVQEILKGVMQQVVNQDSFDDESIDGLGELLEQVKAGSNWAKKAYDVWLALLRRHAEESNADDAKALLAKLDAAGASSADAEDDDAPLCLSKG